MTIGMFFGLFQALLFLLGYISGYGLEGYLLSMNYTLAVIIMLFTGVKMIVGSRRVEPEMRVLAKKDTGGLVTLSLALGINSFITGLALGLISIYPWYLAGLLFAVTCLVTLIGIRLGRTGKYRVGQFAETMAGIVFLCVAAVMLLQYLKIF